MQDTKIIIAKLQADRDKFRVHTCLLKTEN